MTSLWISSIRKSVSVARGRPMAADVEQLGHATFHPDPVDEVARAEIGDDTASARSVIKPERCHAGPRPLAAHEEAVKLVEDHHTANDPTPALKALAGKTLPKLEHHLGMAKALNGKHTQQLFPFAHLCRRIWELRWP